MSPAQLGMNPRDGSPRSRKPQRGFSLRVAVPSSGTHRPPASSAHQQGVGALDGQLQIFGCVAVGLPARCALALIPAGAHLFELPSKIGLPPEQYMTVQSVYRGWAVRHRLHRRPAADAGAYGCRTRRYGRHAAFPVCRACTAATLAVFFAFTYPMNVVTANWTVTPPDFEAARRQWEYSHAFNAVLMLVAFAALALSVLTSRPSLKAA